MNTPSPHSGFTRKELALAIGLLCTGISCYSLAQSPLKSDSGAVSALKQARNIHTMLVAWAQDNDGAFPAAKQFSNEAYRELFKKRLLDGEGLFAIPGDAWHKNSKSGKGPDENIGTGPDFAEALTQGECAFAYVTGWDTASPSQFPLIVNGFSESCGVYSKDPIRKGGVFGGTKSIYVTVGGSAKVADLNSDGKVMEEKDGKAVDLFSEDWGTNPDNLRNPEG